MFRGNILYCNVLVINESMALAFLDRLTPILSGSPSLAAQKAAMSILTPIQVGPTRMPIPPLTDDVMLRLRHVLTNRK